MRLASVPLDPGQPLLLATAKISLQQTISRRDFPALWPPFAPFEYACKTLASGSRFGEACSTMRQRKSHVAVANRESFSLVKPPKPSTQHPT